jgi:putative endonuclease
VCQFSASEVPAFAQNWHTPSPTRHTDRRSVRRVSSDARHDLGRTGESIAAEHLIRRGYRILERNYRTRWGELDIVAYDGAVLAFCEVKTRRLRPGEGNALEAIRWRKRSQIRKMAARWLIERTRRPYADTLRFDAIGVTFDRSGRLASIEHLEGAF